MFGMWVGALSARNGRPTPWNSPRMSNSLCSPILSSTSSLGKSSILITRSAHNWRNCAGNRRNASRANASNSSSEGALVLGQIGGFSPGAVIGNSHAHSAQVGQVEKDREREQTEKAQTAPDAPPPEFEPVDRAVRRAGVLQRIPGGEMIGRALRAARQRRGRKGVAL